MCWIRRLQKSGRVCYPQMDGYFLVYGLWQHQKLIFRNIQHWKIGQPTHDHWSGLDEGTKDQGLFVWWQVIYKVPGCHGPSLKSDGQGFICSYMQGSTHIIYFSFQLIFLYFSASTIKCAMESLKINDSNPSPPPNPAKFLLSSLPEKCAKYLHVSSFHRSFVCAIDSKPNWKPAFGGSYNLALEEQSALRVYLDDLIKKGFICPFESPAPAPIFFRKVKGKKDWPCVHYWCLNKIIKRDSYPIPAIYGLLNSLESRKFVETIDLKAAFTLLRLNDGDKS